MFFFVLFFDEIKFQVREFYGTLKGITAYKFVIKPFVMHHFAIDVCPSNDSKDPY